MGQHQNLAQIQEETAMESIIAGMESGEYFAQMQLQSPVMPPQATLSSASYTFHQSQQDTLFSSQYDYSQDQTMAMDMPAISTPLLASQSQTVFDASPHGLSSTPGVPTPSIIDSGYGFQNFSSSANPLYSSPPPSTGAFSPTLSDSSSYFHQQYQHQQFYTNNTPDPQMAAEGNFMDPGVGWDTPSDMPAELQMGEGANYFAVSQGSEQYFGNLPSGGMAGVATGFTSSPTPPLPSQGHSPQRPHRLLHSQSQPGLRSLQQQQLKQQLQQQQQQQHRRRQHSVHFPSDYVPGDFGSDFPRVNRHVSLPVGSYSAPIPSLASLSELIRESSGGSDISGSPESGTLLSMSLPASAGGFSFLDNPPPPLSHHHHPHHFNSLPLSPPLSSAEIGSMTPPKSRSRAGSKSRSRPTSASSIVSVRNAGAPYSPSTNTISTPSAISNSRSPSLVPLSPIPPFRHGSSADSESPAPKPAFETGLIIVPGVNAPLTVGGKAKRISRIKAPTKSRSRSSTITSTSAPHDPNSANSSFLVLSEEEENALKSLEHSDKTIVDEQFQHFQYQQLGQQQQEPGGLFDLPLGQDIDNGGGGLVGGEDESGIDAEGVDMSNFGSTEEGLEGEFSEKTALPGTKPMACPIPSCHKTFARPFNLNAHVKSHDTLKPYGCHVCPRVFSRKHDLQRHIRVHTGSKPYVCVKCQKAFARTDALCRHYKTEEVCQQYMQQDEVRKQAQQQVQQQLHQEQLELQQAQQAHAEAKAHAQAVAQAQVMHPYPSALDTSGGTHLPSLDELSEPVPVNVSYADVDTAKSYPDVDQTQEPATTIF
ncbi:hypothetical protein BGZ93_006905 [Podila epicladia]|nr:hypothetical protein BGZ92_008108 [Podila epicladia]KAG0094690.1 hypothetical protein BGZ93_006905 [Podila epicladia]